MPRTECTSRSNLQAIPVLNRPCDISIPLTLVALSQHLKLPVIMSARIIGGVCAETCWIVIKNMILLY